MFAMKLLVASLFLFAMATVAAERSTAYYPDGMEDPNVNTKMYWADAISVLEDISKFDALYITHHGCA